MKAEAFWKAKQAAVELGRPLEGWSAADIRRDHGRLESPIHRPAEGFPGDDDLTMPLALLMAWQERGLDATPDEISQAWHRSLPITWFWRFRRWQLVGRHGVAAGRNTEHRGGHIGAMLMADLCGAVSPGDSEAARRRAEAMGRVCAAGKGVEAAGWVADVAARIAGGDSAAAAVSRALAVEPAEWIKDLGAVVQSTAMEDFPEKIAEHLAEPRLLRTILPGSLGRPEPWVRAEPNLAIVMAAWLWSGEDAWSAAMAAVRLGWDTDSNAGIV
ncbi:MAG: ADP-ribosylglycohydrolase family protein, partial [Fimbriimonadaceae bacterium]|nr:ADP-ribosylglycohydrolase family protein [Fimbriimonadaceae bacterium]